MEEGGAEDDQDDAQPQPGVEEDRANDDAHLEAVEEENGADADDMGNECQANTVPATGRDGGRELGWGGGDRGWR